MSLSSHTEAVIYNLAMRCGHCHTSHPGTWERMSALSVTSSLFGEMMSQIKCESLQVYVGFVVLVDNVYNFRE